MTESDKIILLVLLLFFAFYSVFVRWPGMDEYSRFFLSLSIVFHDTFKIDNYYNQTSDRSYFLGHYYSDKEPGLSIISTLFLMIEKIIFDTLNFDLSLTPERYFVELHNGVKIVVATLQPLYIRIAQFIVIVFTSNVFTLLTSIIIFRSINQITKDRQISILSMIIYLLSTLSFHYSLVYLNHAFSTFLIFMSVILLINNENRLSGMIAGLSFFVDPQSVIIYLAVLLAYISLKKSFSCLFNSLLYFFIGSLPFLVYNYSIFGNPFDFPRYYLDPEVWSKLPGYNGIIINPVWNVNTAIRLMFYPYRGIFFYYPVLLFSFISLFNSRLNRVFVVIPLVAFLSNLIFSSLWWAWWHGACFGARHMLISIPFLTFLLGLSLRKVLKSRTMKTMFLVLLFYSILVNVSGLQKNYEDLIKDKSTSYMLPEYKERFKKFLPLENVVFEYYINGFLHHGIYSPIIENWLYNKTFSVVPLS